MSRPTPDETAPSMEGADERAFLAFYLECWGDHVPPAGDYHLVRGDYEQAVIRNLPARVPRRLRRAIG